MHACDICVLYQYIVHIVSDCISMLRPQLHTTIILSARFFVPCPAPASTCRFAHYLQRHEGSICHLYVSTSDSAAGGYCHTALPGSRGFSTKHPDGCRGCTFMPDVFARAHRPHRTDHTCIWGSASGLASGCGGGLCALDLWLLQNSGRAHVPVRATSVGM